MFAPFPWGLLMGSIGFVLFFLVFNANRLVEQLAEVDLPDPPV